MMCWGEARGWVPERKYKLHMKGNANKNTYDEVCCDGFPIPSLDAAALTSQGITWDNVAHDKINTPTPKTLFNVLAPLIGIGVVKEKALPVHNGDFFVL